MEGFFIVLPLKKKILETGHKNLDNMNNKCRCLDIEEFKQVLKKHALKATPQRLAVHSAMMKLGHASADMVTEEIKACGDAKVTLASVYNILTGLAGLGIYKHRMSTNNKMYFDVNTFKHMHLYDQDNHCFRDIIDEKLYEMIEQYLKKKRFRGFKIEGIDLQVIARPSKKTVPKARH